MFYKAIDFKVILVWKEGTQSYWFSGWVSQWCWPTKLGSTWNLDDFTLSSSHMLQTWQDIRQVTRQYNDSCSLFIATLGICYLTAVQFTWEVEVSKISMFLQVAEEKRETQIKVHMTTVSCESHWVTEQCVLLGWLMRSCSRTAPDPFLFVSLHDLGMCWWKLGNVELTWWCAPFSIGWREGE